MNKTYKPITKLLKRDTERINSVYTHFKLNVLMPKIKEFKFVHKAYHGEELTAVKVSLPENTKFLLWNNEHPYDLETPCHIWTIIKDSKKTYFTRIKHIHNRNTCICDAYHFCNGYTVACFNNAYVPKNYIADKLPYKIKWDDYIYLWFDKKDRLTEVSKIIRIFGFGCYEYQSVKIEYNQDIDDFYIETSIKAISKSPDELISPYTKGFKTLNTEEAHKIYDTLQAYAVNKQLGKNILQFNEDYFNDIIFTDYVKNLVYKPLDDIDNSTVSFSILNEVNVNMLKQLMGAYSNTWETYDLKDKLSFLTKK